MSLLQSSHDSLPYIDPDIDAPTRDQISTLLSAELPPSHTTSPHPLLPDLPPPRFTTAITNELERVAAKAPLSAIDTSRYEELSPPSGLTSPGSNENDPAFTAAWRETLQKAYTSSSHLSARLQNLALLEQFGKNAWLVGNAQLEDTLRRLEQELVETKGQVEEVNKARKRTQEDMRGEMEALAEGWKSGVGRAVETEIAAEELRRKILDERRAGAR